MHVTIPLYELPKSTSGFHVKADQVTQLVETFERMATAGRVPFWCLIDMFPFLKAYHVAAFAREAGIPQPTTQEVVKAVQEGYRLTMQNTFDRAVRRLCDRHQYWGNRNQYKDGPR